MKKVIALSIFLIVVAVGCASGSTEQPSSTTSSKRTTTTISQSSLVDAYVSAVSSEFPGSTRSDYISLGKTACETLDRFGSIDATLTEIVLDTTITSSEARDLGFIIGVAIPAFCPEYTSELDSLR